MKAMGERNDMKEKMIRNMAIRNGAKAAMAK
jgi:hypothetical protein